MKIVVLDGYCLNPGDLSWDALRRFGQVEIFDRTPAADVKVRLEGAALTLTNKTPIRESSEPPARAARRRNSART
jgi:glycerate dehydrogenase